jgi:RHS repeat-associated protein
MTTLAQSFGGTSGPQVVFGYDAASRVITESRTIGNSGTAVTTSIAYDSADRTTSITHQVSGGSSLDSFVYNYDSGGRLKTETNTEGLATYGYDPANQLTSVTRPVGQTNEAYSFDSGGNRTMTGYTTGAGNELTASPGETYTYDAEGNMTGKTDTATHNVWSYTYDVRNRLTGVTEKNSGGSTIYSASYVYDPLDRRIEVNSGGSVMWTVYNGQNTYADFNSGGTLLTRYLYGPAVDELLARTTSGGTSAWYMTDRLGSVRDVVSTAGSNLDHIAYDGFGIIVSQSNAGNGDRFKWTGREWDGTTGLQENRERYYAPSVGRWTQSDPCGFGGRATNLYIYVHNNSLNYEDPSGEIPLLLPIIAIGGLSLLIGGCSEPPPAYVGPTRPFPAPKPHPMPGGQLALQPPPPLTGLYVPQGGGGTTGPITLRPTDVIGVTGVGPCAGIIFVPPNPNLPYEAMHIGPVYQGTLTDDTMLQVMASYGQQGYSILFVGDNVYDSIVKRYYEYNKSLQEYYRCRYMGWIQSDQGGIDGSGNVYMGTQSRP